MFPSHDPASAYTVGGILCLNLIQEFYGDKQSRKVLSFSFIGLIVFMLMGLFQNMYQSPPHCSEIETSFKVILGFCPRIVVSSLVVTFIMDRFDMFLFKMMKNKMPKADFSLRFLCSILITQFLDTVLFTFIGLWGIISHPWDCILIAYTIKLITIILMGLVLMVGKKWVASQFKD